MTRFAIDAPTALRMIREQPALGPHTLVGPAALRTDVLRSIYRDVRDGRLEEKAGLAELERLAGLRIRLLGDRVSRATAWKIASRLGWPDLGDAEYLAVAQLQADALVTTDDALRAGAEGIVPIAAFGDLLGEGAAGR